MNEKIKDFWNEHKTEIIMACGFVTTVTVAGVVGYKRGVKHGTIKGKTKGIQIGTNATLAKIIKDTNTLGRVVHKDKHDAVMFYSLDEKNARLFDQLLEKNGMM